MISRASGPSHVVKEVIGIIGGDELAISLSDVRSICPKT